MKPPERDKGEDRRAVGIILGSYALGFIVAALILWPQFDFFRRRTDSGEEAVDLFVTVCAVLAGFGPMIVLGVTAVRRTLSRRGR